MTMVDLIAKDNVCGGIIIMDTDNNEVYPVYGQNMWFWPAAVWADCIRIPQTSAHITGDALGIALNHQIVSWHIWITYRSIRRHCFPKNRDERFLVSRV